jgi:sirohydrochlorin ferrochelatase
MPEMSKYSKAYSAEQFRAFPGWSEKTPPAKVTLEEDGETPGESLEYFFLHDNYVVTAGIFNDEEVAFDAVTDEWRNFCHEALGFDPEGADAVQEDAATADVQS